MTDGAMRRFPIQRTSRYRGPNQGMKHIPETTIPWSVAEEAYRVYSRKYGKDQSLERLAERGGFGRDELIYLLSGGEDESQL